jgi:hypothetical protein
MTAPPIRIADAVASLLNAAETANAFTLGGWVAERSYADWDASFEDLSGLAVDVVFVSMGAENSVALDSYETMQSLCTIHVAVRKRFGVADRNDSGRLINASVDSLVSLVSEIGDYLAERRLTNTLPLETEVTWRDSEVVQFVNQDLLRQGLFQGVIALRFGLSREMLA